MNRNSNLTSKLPNLILVLILVACASSETFVDYGNSGERKPAGCKLDIYPEGTSVDRPAEVLGEIGFGDTGFSVNCGAETVLGKIRARACEVGADAVQLFNVRHADAASTCYRASARFLRYTAAEAIEEPDDSESSVGTGWISEYGLIVTNSHVIDKRKRIRVVMADGRTLSARVLLVDTVNDIALLETDDFSALPSGLRISDAQGELGSSVFTIGYPHPDILGTSAKLNAGLISGLTGMQNDPRTYQISIPVQAGNSGGPLFNDHGEVIGVVSYKLNAIAVFKWTGDLTENINYAVKTSYVEALLSNINNKVQHPSVAPKPGSIKEQAKRVINSVVMVVAE